MKRVNTFTFRVNDQERRLIELLSNRLKRNQSDAVRFVIREAAAALATANPVAETEPLQSEATAG